MGLVEGKVALVTGASSGIGRATAILFAAEGAKVVATDIVVDGGEETVKMIKDAGGDAVFIKSDVSKAADVEASVKFAVDTYGKLNCAHNNAGIDGPMTPIVDYAEADWDKVIAINLTGVWLGMKHQVPAMLASGGGAIVSTASIAGLLGIQGMSAYCASKWGVNGITKVAALEYSTAGVRVNSVCPGVIETPMVTQIMEENPEMMDGFLAATPLGRIGQPDDVAQAVVWLCSDRASFVTGHNMVVDGGYASQ